MVHISFSTMFFNAYQDFKKHWKLLLIASALTSGVWILHSLLDPLRRIKPHYTASELLDHSKDQQELAQNVQAVSKQMQEEERQKTPWSIALLFLFLMISIFLGLGMCRITLDIVDKGQSSFSALFLEGRSMLPSILAGILLSFGFLLITSLLVVLLTFGILKPLFGSFAFIKLLQALGVFVLIMAMLFLPKVLFLPWYILDKRLGVIDSMKCSWRLSGKAYWRLLGVLVMMSFFYSFSLVFFRWVFKSGYFGITCFELAAFFSSFSQTFFMLLFVRIYRSLEQQK